MKQAWVFTTSDGDFVELLPHGLSNVEALRLVVDRWPEEEPFRYALIHNPKSEIANFVGIPQEPSYRIVGSSAQLFEDIEP